MIRLKRFSAFLLLLTLLLSCERFDFDDTGNLITDEEVLITFHVDGLQQVPFDNAVTTRSVLLGEHCSRLTLAVFRGDEKLKNITQQSSDASFGSISVGLSPGIYRVVALAYSGLGSATVSSPEKITFASNKCSDTFYYYGEVEVSESASQSLVLKRAVAAFRLKTTDNIPNDITKMQFYYTGGSSTFDAVSGYGCVNSKQTETFEVTSSMIGKPAEFQVYTFPHADEGVLKMTVTALDASGQTVCEKVYDQLPVTINRISVWEGAFFQSTNTNKANSLTFSLENDGEWGGTQNVN